MSAGGLPGEAVWRLMGAPLGRVHVDGGPEPSPLGVGETMEVVSLADPASALRAVLSDPAGREAAVETVARVLVDADLHMHTRMECLSVDADPAHDIALDIVDVLASGSEPERDLAGDLDRLIRRIQGLALPRSFEAVGERGGALHHLGAARYSVARLDALASGVEGDDGTEGDDR